MLKQHGFTLIELVVVIVILGVLAATALPKILNLGKDARIATVNHVAGAVKSAANLAYLTCYSKGACLKDSTSASVAFIGPNGVTGVLFHSYPTGLSRVPSYFGIKDWLNLEGGVTLYELTAPTAEIRVDSAPNPAACKVTYLESYGSGPIITITTSGC